MAEILLTREDAGKVQSVKVGDTLVIRLPENPTTGYRWMVKVTNTESILVPASKEIEYEVSPDSGMGGGGVRTLRFKVKSPGTTLMRLIRKRTWESDGQADDQFYITLNASSA